MPCIFLWLKLYVIYLRQLEQNVITCGIYDQKIVLKKVINNKFIKVFGPCCKHVDLMPTTNVNPKHNNMRFLLKPYNYTLAFWWGILDHVAMQKKLATCKFIKYIGNSGRWGEVMLHLWLSNNSSIHAKPYGIPMKLKKLMFIHNNESHTCTCF